MRKGTNACASSRLEDRATLKPASRHPRAPIPVNGIGFRNVDCETGYGTSPAGVSGTVSPFQDPFRKPPFAKYPAGPGTGSTRLSVCGICLRIEQANRPSRPVCIRLPYGTHMGPIYVHICSFPDGETAGDAADYRFVVPLSLSSSSGKSSHTASAGSPSLSSGIGIDPHS